MSYRSGRKAMTSGLMGPSATIEWGTPQDLFDRLDAEFHFTLDVCASDGMQMCQRYYNPQTDGLAHEWGGGRSMLDEPALRSGDRQVGAQGGHGASSHSRPITSAHGYPLVSGVGPALCLGGQIPRGPSQIQRRNIGRTLPVHHSHIQHAENAPLWGHGGIE